MGRHLLHTHIFLEKVNLNEKMRQETRVNTQGNARVNNDTQNTTPPTRALADCYQKLKGWISFAFCFSLSFIMNCAAHHHKSWFELVWAGLFGEIACRREEKLVFIPVFRSNCYCFKLQIRPKWRSRLFPAQQASSRPESLSCTRAIFTLPVIWIKPPARVASGLGEKVKIHSPVLLSYFLNELQIKKADACCILSLLSCGIFGGKGYLSVAQLFFW